MKELISKTSKSELHLPWKVLTHENEVFRKEEKAYEFFFFDKY